MARKALLIGSETGKLAGVHNDVTAMSDALTLWGFTSIRCERENASRAGILDAYERFISQARPDDALVVFYSGHGGYAHDTGYGTPSPHALQFIVPTDYEESRAGDFRGITAPELSVLLARLTERTDNVTVVLDCCHSGHMSRDPAKIVKHHPRAVPAHVIRAHIDTVRREGLALDLWHPPGNPHAVRLVACAPEQSAVEAPNAEGVRMGYLTDALTRTLVELHGSGLTASWATIIDRIRKRVLEKWAGQRPEAEGPAHRIVFDTNEVEPLGALPISESRGRVRIAGAALLGVRRGDAFVVMPDDSPEPDASRKLGDVLVDHVDAQAAYGVMASSAPLPVTARAHLVHTAIPPLPVHTSHPVLRQAVDASPLLCADPNADTRVEEDAGFTIHDVRGPLHAPRPTPTALLADLRNIARARALRCLSQPAGLTLTAPVSISFARVKDGVTTPLAQSGATVYSGQSICVEVRNNGDDTIYVSLLDVGVSSKISILNPSAPSGIRLDPGVAYTFGGNDHTGALPGMAVDWPPSVPPLSPRQETLIVLVSEEPTDTRVLEQQGIRRGRQSRLEQQLSTMSPGAHREVVPEPGRPVRFAVHTIDFDLDPNPAPPGEGAVFQVDDRPPTTITGTQGDVTLFLSDLVVHHNRTSRGDVRLDALIVTTDTAGPRINCRTEHFTDVSDGERLPLHTSPVFQGTAHDRLDVAVWISPSNRTETDLATLLSDHAESPVPVLIDTAHHLLGSLLGEATGVYRTTLPITAGTFAVRAKDFSFHCTVSGPSNND